MTTLAEYTEQVERIERDEWLVDDDYGVARPVGVAALRLTLEHALWQPQARAEAAALVERLDAYLARCAAADAARAW